MITAKVHGLDDLHRKFAKMELLAKGAMKAAVMKGSEPIRDEAQRLAPVSDKPGGHMARGIKIRLMRSTAPGHERTRIGVKAPLWYSVFPEFGTSKMAAHPFMRPALDTQQKEALRIFKEELARRIT